MRDYLKYLVLFSSISYMIFRIVVVYFSQTGRDFIISPIDDMTEIVLLFITFLCLVLIGKRKMAGAIIYLGVYWVYFGIDIVRMVKQLIAGQSINAGFEILMSSIAMILPLFAIIDLSLDKVKKPLSKQTEWFYGNEKYEREYDERADKNQYRL